MWSLLESFTELADTLAAAIRCVRIAFNDGGEVPDAQPVAHSTTVHNSHARDTAPQKEPRGRQPVQRN